MIESIEDLLCVPDEDTFSNALGDDAAPEGESCQQLLAAWLEERGRAIESSLMLGRARRLLARISATGRLTAKGKREVEHVLRAIDVFERGGAPLQA